MDKLFNIAELAGAVSAIAAAVCLCIRPLRERLLGLREIKEGQRCMLRSELLHTYYKHRTEQMLRQYEFENFIYLYKAYKKLGGNSFIDRIYQEVSTWQVVT